jgi:CDP-glucose 4,6-dehydratase
MTEPHFDDVYRGRRVLVTGHTGFKGSWLALWLHRLGAEVHGFALEPPTEPSLFREAEVEGCLASHRIGDIRDHAGLTAHVSAVQPEIVFHLAAQPLVRRSYLEPRETYDVNVMGTVNMLEAVRAAGSVRVCQLVTSDKCYENREWALAYRENDPMGGFDPYSSSKGCAELVAAAYRRSFFTAGAAGMVASLATARAGNVIGGGDWAEDRIVPDCIRALEAGLPVPVRNPRAVRPWQHVLDALGGYLHLAARQWSDPVAFSDAWNFGPLVTGTLPVLKLAELVVAEWGDGAIWTDPAAARAGAVHEAAMLRLDIAKAQSLLGWQPLLDTAEAVRLTVQWHRMHRHAPPTRARELCGLQIDHYTELAARAGQPWAAPHPGMGYARC